MRISPRLATGTLDSGCAAILLLRSGIFADESNTFVGRRGEAAFWRTFDANLLRRPLSDPETVPELLPSCGLVGVRAPSPGPQTALCGVARASRPLRAISRAPDPPLASRGVTQSSPTPSLESKVQALAVPTSPSARMEGQSVRGVVEASGGAARDGCGKEEGDGAGPHAPASGEALTDVVDGSPSLTAGERGLAVGGAGPHSSAPAASSPAGGRATPPAGGPFADSVAAAATA